MLSIYIGDLKVLSKNNDGTAIVGIAGLEFCIEHPHPVDTRAGIFPHYVSKNVMSSFEGKDAIPVQGAIEGDNENKTMRIYCLCPHHYKDLSSSEGIKGNGRCTAVLCPVKGKMMHGRHFCQLKEMILSGSATDERHFSHPCYGKDTFNRYDVNFSYLSGLPFTIYRNEKGEYCVVDISLAPMGDSSRSKMVCYDEITALSALGERIVTAVQQSAIQVEISGKGIHDNPTMDETHTVRLLCVFTKEGGMHSWNDTIEFAAKHHMMTHPVNYLN